MPLPNAKACRLLKCLLLPLALGACGDDGKGPAAAGGDAIKIGLLTTLTGALGRQGPTHRAAADMAVREINAAGGVLGRELEVVVADSETDPGQGLLLDGGVAAIVGPIISSATLRVAEEVAIPRGALILSPASTSPEISGLDDDGLVWRTAASDVLKAQVAAGLAFDLGARRAGVVFVDNSFGRGLADEFARLFVELGGAVPNRVPYPELTGNEIEAYDYRLHVAQVMEGEPDLIYFITFVEDGAKIAIAADARVSDAYSPIFLAEIPPAAGALSEAGIYEGLYGVEQASPASANHRLFLERYRELFSSEPDLFADAVYDAVYLLALAMERAGGTGSREIAARLAEVSAGGAPVNVGEAAKGLDLARRGEDIDYEGASGSIEFDGRGDVASATYRIWKVENGTIIDLETVLLP